MSQRLQQALQRWGQSSDPLPIVKQCTRPDFNCLNTLFRHLGGHPQLVPALEHLLLHNLPLNHAVVFGNYARVDSISPENMPGVIELFLEAGIDIVKNINMIPMSGRSLDQVLNQFGNLNQQMSIRIPTDSMPPAMIKMLGSNGDTKYTIQLIHYAILKNWPIDILERLVQCGADLNCPVSYRSKHIFSYCLVHTPQQMVFLIKHGANLRPVGSSKYLPWLIHDTIEMFEILLPIMSSEEIDEAFNHYLQKREHGPNIVQMFASYTPNMEYMSSKQNSTYQYLSAQDVKICLNFGLTINLPQVNPCQMRCSYLKMKRMIKMGPQIKPTMIRCYLLLIKERATTNELLGFIMHTKDIWCQIMGFVY